MALGYGRTSTQNFGCCKFIVDINGIQNGATHSTIQSAIDDASSGDTIFIRNGTYTENITLPAGIHLTSFGNATDIYKVKINGKVTMTAGGFSVISDIELVTNADYCIEITGSNTVGLRIFHCRITCSGNDAILVNNSSASIVFNNCLFSRNANFAMWTLTSCSEVKIENSVAVNASATSTPSTIAAGTLICNYCSLQLNLSASGTGIIRLNFCDVIPTSNSVGLTTAGTGSGHLVYNTLFISGTAACISCGTGTTILVSNSIMESTNSSPISGAGTVNYSSIAMSSTGNGITPTTTTGYYTQLGKWRAQKQPCFNAYNSSADTNVTGAGTKYTIDFDTELFDQDSNFSSDTFTAPVTGKYLLSTSVQCATFSSSMTTALFRIETSNNTFATQSLNPYACRNTSSGAYVFTGSVICDMDAADTAIVTIQIFDGAGDTAQVSGAGRQTYFSGALLN